MKKTLKYISISHKTASLAERECFFLNIPQQKKLQEKINIAEFDISGLMIVSTCNRTEIYFESNSTTATEMRDFFIDFSGKKGENHPSDLFQYSNTTIETVRHLLRVSNGLHSAVLGDAQILAQLKEAYQAALKSKQQGSLLERAIQSVFKTHKRISNETDYHKGSQSTAYKALKIIEEEFGKRHLSTKKLLLIGAGDIASQVALYLQKFPFKLASIANRTQSKAEIIAHSHDFLVENWSIVEENKLGQFDAIISAVSNRSNLINQLETKGSKKVCIDLAIPSNINKDLAKNELIKRYGLDEITESIDLDENKRQQATKSVEEIIDEEMNGFIFWIKKNRVRSFLKAYKQSTQLILKENLSASSLHEKLDEKELNFLINQISDKLVKEPAVTLFTANSGELSPQSLEFIQKAFTSKKNQHETNRHTNH